MFFTMLWKERDGFWGQCDVPTARRSSSLVGNHFRHRLDVKHLQVSTNRFTDSVLLRNAERHGFIRHDTLPFARP